MVGAFARLVILARAVPDSSTLRRRTADGRHLDALVVAHELQRLVERDPPGGTRRTSSSLVEERMLVSFFSLVGLTSRSSPRPFSPTITPS